MRRCQSKPGLAGCETSFQRARRAQVSVRTRQVTHSHGYTDVAALRKLVGMHGCRQLPATAGQCAADLTGTSARSHTSKTQQLPLFLYGLNLLSRSTARLKNQLSRALLCLENCSDLPWGLLSPSNPDPLRQVWKKSWQTEDTKYCSDRFRRTARPCWHNTVFRKPLTKMLARPYSSAAGTVKILVRANIPTYLPVLSSD